MASPPLDSTCFVCGKKCRKLQCSRCHEVNYCSVACQRIDWDRGGHKLKCGAPRRKIPPNAAWSELQQTLMSMTPQEAHQHFQMAQDEIRRLEQEEKERVDRKKEDSSRSERSVVQQPHQQQEKARIAPTEEAIFAVPLSNTVQTEKSVPIMKGEHISRRDWSYVVEEMPNISSYQCTLWPEKGKEIPDSNDILLSTQQNRHGNTVVMLKSDEMTIFSAQFPGRLEAPAESASAVQFQNDCLSLRLQARDAFDDTFCKSRTSILAAIQSLSCRYCGQAILMEAEGIEKVLQLPKGHWDEVTDYLICYNGQPAVDFSSASTSAQEHLAFEDSSVVVLHCNDVKDGICVLAVDGYGEASDNANNIDETTDSATFRGPRAWRDSVGGATLCCSQCCAILGFASLASPETFRLLKHRLSSKSDEQWNNLHSCASFVAHEIVRYAESKAIYTFVVSVRSEGTPSSHPRCILLKLLSWDTRQSKSEDSTLLEEVDLLDFKPVVRVIYEITSDRDTAHDNDDPMSWTWGGVDLCCLPDNTESLRNRTNEYDQAKQPSAASVRLWLSLEEFGELEQTLVESSKCFSKAVTDATILVKLGPKQEKSDSDTIGLGALPLV